MATSSNRLISAVQGVLQANLPSAAAAENLPPVVEWLTYDPAFFDATKTPQIWLALQRINRGQLAAFGGVNAKQARNRVLAVGVAVAGEDPATASAVLHSYVDLVTAVLESHPSAGGEGLTVTLLDAALSPNLSENPGGLAKEAVLTFSIPRWAALGQD